MSQMEEFLKQVEAVQGKEEKVLIVTGKPGSGKSKLLREAAEAKGWDYVEKLCSNLDGKLLSGSSAVYKGVADGEYTVGLTFEEGGAKYVADGAPVKLVYMKEGVISKPDGIYIIKNAKHMENAKKFIDFITSKEAQTLITQKLHRRSVRDDVPAPQGLQDKSTINIIQDDENVVNQNKKAWLDKFKDIFTSTK